MTWQPKAKIIGGFLRILEKGLPRKSDKQKAGEREKQQKSEK